MFHGLLNYTELTVGRLRNIEEEAGRMEPGKQVHSSFNGKTTDQCRGIRVDKITQLRNKIT
jgi:hypothetical protein